jgi:hypothetical protein
MDFFSYFPYVHNFTLKRTGKVFGTLHIRAKFFNIIIRYFGINHYWILNPGADVQQKQI